MQFSLVFLAAAASASPLSIPGLSGLSGLTSSLTSGLSGLTGSTTGSTTGLTSGVTGAASGLLSSLTGQIGQVTQLTQLPTCALTCINASAAKVNAGSLSVFKLGSLCGDVTDVINGATTCLTACKLPGTQATTVTTTLKSVCSALQV